MVVYLFSGLDQKLLKLFLSAVMVGKDMVSLYSEGVVGSGKR